MRSLDLFYTTIFAPFNGVNQQNWLQLGTHFGSEGILNSLESQLYLMM